MNKTNDSVHFIITGGTIDSYYDGTKDTVVPSATSIIPSFINSLKLYTPVEFTEICMKDSRSLNEADRKKIVETLEKMTATKIILTHGTYTMPDTARYVEANLTRKDQVIILTGSMIPINGFSPSDGPFNLGFAFSQLNSLKPGVYVAMNGRIFSPTEVVKILDEGRFSSVFNK